MDSSLKLITQLVDQFSDALVGAVDGTTDEIALRYAMAIMNGLKEAAHTLNELMRADLERRIRIIAEKAGLS